MNVMERTCTAIFPQDSDLRRQAVERLEQLTMPHWALGDLMDLAVDLAGMTGSLRPPVGRKVIVTMAADHGVAAEGVSKFPSAVTQQMVHNIAAGGAGVNALARCAGADVVVVDMGVDGDLSELARGGKILDRKVSFGTNNIAREPAMSIANARRAVEYGIGVAAELGQRYDVFGTGDMGIGNTTPSSAIAAAVTGKPVEELTGRGTGLDDQQLCAKVDTIKRVLERHRPDPKNGLEVLATVGGFEIGGIAGLIIGAAAQRKPVVVDGFISGAGALIAHLIEPFVRDYIVCAHRSTEPGHRFVQEFIGCFRPLLDLNLHLGEGTGGALAMPLLDGAAALLTEVATFAEAAVARADK